MRSFIVNKEKIEVPTKWSQVPYWKYVLLAESKEKTEAKTIQLLTGLDPNARIGGQYQFLLKCLEFVKKPIDVNYVPPKFIKFKDKVIEIPTDIGNEMLAQYTDLKELLTEDNVHENMATACAIYFQPLVDGDYSIKKAKAMVEDIKRMPADFVFCIGGFFLTRALGLPNGFMLTYLRAGTRMRRLKQGMNNLMRRLGL